MSIEAVNKFLERLQTDSAFAKQVADANSIEVRTKIVRDAGFKFTYDELTQVADQIEKTGELSAERLKTAVGGLTTMSTTYTTLGLSPTGFSSTAFSSLFGVIRRPGGAVAGISVFE